MAFELPHLPYPIDALAPHISKETLEFHHGKHHATYVTNLNNLTKGTPNEGKSVEEIMKSAGPGGLFNNSAQHYNHSFYWKSLAPKGGGEPSGALADGIKKAYGDFEAFKKTFNETTAKQFGSGWGFLVFKGGKLEIVTKPNQDSPLSDGLYPILGNDVWEHAYYLKYQNKRPDYLAAWWGTVNWDEINKRFEHAQK